MKSNLILFGLPGVGKTTVGEELARLLERPFFDTDELIAETVGVPTRRIYQTMGEAYFRGLERQALEGLAAAQRGVIAAGGGTPLEGEEGTLILLEGDWELLWSRRKGLAVLDPDDPKGSFFRLCEGRVERMRAIAHHVIQVGERDPLAIATQIQEEVL